MAEQEVFYSDISGQEFAAQVLNEEQMVIVDFSSDQSNACQIFDPEFAAISKEYRERVKFVRLRVDQEKTLVDEWHIDGIPTVIFYKNGREINRIKGIVMREKLRRQIEGVLVAHP